MSGRLARFRIGKNTRDVARALRYIVLSAYNEVPVYRHLWEAYGPGTFRLGNGEDLQRLPVVRKSDLVRVGLPERLRLGTDVGRCVRRGTSGSTGSPIDILFGRSEFRYRQFAFFRRIIADLGGRLPLRLAEVGAWIPRELRSKPLRRGAIVSVLRLPRSLPSDKQIRALERFRPHVVSGCPGDLQLVAVDLARNPSARLSPRLVICRGETLYPNVEALLQQAFGCRVTDYYNAQEIGNLAWRCPDNPGRMHVNQDTALMEVVDAEGRRLPAGIEGEVVVTNLTNATMPFIRYALGDRAWWIDTESRRCSCGALGPVLSPIQGRSDDFIVLPDGRRVAPRAIDDLVMETFHATPQTSMFLSGIHAYQVVQEAIDHLIVRVETSSTLPPSLLLDVLNEGLRAFHKDLTVEFQFVTELAREETGKFRRVVSALGHKAIRSGWDGPSSAKSSLPDGRSKST